MRTSFNAQPDRSVAYAEQLDFTALLSQLRPYPLHRFYYPRFQIFRMKAVKNENAADQRIAAQPVDDVHPRLPSVGYDVERFLQGSAVQIHQRLHQILSGSSYRGIGDRFDFLK